ncbi:MAG: anhydro-N-acetylmuramic acid kinase [Bacteroidia bacterium]|nr:anhydro-N-acetylmuramic acid kinase [Bacteroidia bacterium]
MSGTSLDGLDLALCEFKPAKGKYSYRIIKAKTVLYPYKWKHLLSEAKHANAKNYVRLHAEYGAFIAKEANKFLKPLKRRPYAIASHGHTVFHQPLLGFSTQIGCGATIAAHTGITTVCDFRSLDVANKGQGAPLVPIGDKFLFGDFQACLNIGGIANISFDKNGKRIAYDICEANMLLNHLSEKLGRAFDKDGELARGGKVNKKTLAALNDRDYYSNTGAKSIGREWFEREIMPQLKGKNIQSLLATAVEHIAHVIASDLDKHKIKNVLVTGGGAFNAYLVEKIRSKTKCRITIPDAETINFKEALIFAFLGYLRLNTKTNTLSSVTGARRDSCGGAVYQM